ncbi:MAG: TetR/AcrR family transcriptional regulator [Ardenticatenaceae bacterium]|nr:TetR/AcrR family transcriptional regulator [Ardenticatenaceae bacterium]
MTTEPTPTFVNDRRERRIAARKQQILDAAAHVFSQKGYERATTREIAETADLAEGTLYNYFPSKRDLLIGVAQHYAEEVIADIDNAQAETFEGMLTQIMANRFRRGQERRLFMLFLHEARHNEDVHEHYMQGALQRIITETEKRLQKLIETGLIRPVDPVVAARTLSATIMGFAALFELGGSVGHSSPEQLGAEVTDIFINGLKQQT